jgi:hypothetical protein
MSTHSIDIRGRAPSLDDYEGHWDDGLEPDDTYQALIIEFEDLQYKEVDNDTGSANGV